MVFILSYPNPIHLTEIPNIKSTGDEMIASTNITDNQWLCESKAHGRQGSTGRTEHRPRHPSDLQLSGPENRPTQHNWWQNSGRIRLRERDRRPKACQGSNWVIKCYNARGEWLKQHQTVSWLHVDSLDCKWKHSIIYGHSYKRLGSTCLPVNWFAVKTEEIDFVYIEKWGLLTWKYLIQFWEEQ